MEDGPAEGRIGEGPNEGVADTTQEESRRRDRIIYTRSNLDLRILLVFFSREAKTRNGGNCPEAAAAAERSREEKYIRHSPVPPPCVSDHARRRQAETRRIRSLGR